MGIVKNLTGKRFGNLVAIKKTGVNKHGKSVWLCKCDCGNLTEKVGNDLTKGDTKSCGKCGYQKSQAAKSNYAKKTKNGFYVKSKKPPRITAVWRDMLRRCENKNDFGYVNYGGRGIIVCEQWHDIKKFADWAYANGYDENANRGECTLDRIDVNGNYCPENCRFVTMFEQNCNRRNTLTVRYQNVDTPLMKIAKENGVNYRYLYDGVIRCGKEIDVVLKELESA